MATLETASTYRPRYISAKEAVVLLDYMVTERDLQRWARQGRIPGAVKVGPKTVRFDRRSVLALVRDLSTENRTAEVQLPSERPLVWHDRRAHTTFDSRPLN